MAFKKGEGSIVQPIDEKTEMDDVDENESTRTKLEKLGMYDRRKCELLEKYRKFLSRSGKTNADNYVNYISRIINVCCTQKKQDLSVYDIVKGD